MTMGEQAMTKASAAKAKESEKAAKKAPVKKAAPKKVITLPSSYSLLPSV